MADCGATGSALDQSASRLLTSALGGPNQTNEAAHRAGKAIGNFLGSVAPNASANLAGGGVSMMGPSVTPTTLAQLHPMGTMNGPGMTITTQSQGDVMQRTSMNSGLHHPLPMTHMPQAFHPSQMMHPAQQQAQIHQHMQMQVQTMNQQMAMMQMHQQQQQQQQQQQFLSQQYQQREMLKESTRVQEDVKAATASSSSKTAWHDGLDQLEEEDYYQAFLERHGNDVISVDENDATREDQFAEAMAKGATIEELAEAWAEAEQEYSQEGYVEEEIDAAVNLGNGHEMNKPEPYQFSDMSQLDEIQQGHGQTQIPNIDYMGKGMEHFRQGQTVKAILCFESELQNVDMDNSDAWLMLGKCHAENDQDRKAIVCLENAVERDPYSSEALLSLGVSYVNELDYERALCHLTNWVTHNPNYAGMVVPVQQEGGTEEAALDRLKSLLNSAKSFDDEQGNMTNSANLLEALGVVLNVSREYDEAVRCLRLATDVRQDEYALWNKLGATLANSNRSEEALPAYHKALSLKPKYARAWLNMAIANSNLENHEEAARCYLQTLSLNPSATHIWSYLRIALTCSEKWDLLPLAASQNLDEFKKHYDFVRYDS